MPSRGQRHFAIHLYLQSLEITCLHEFTCMLHMIVLGQDKLELPEGESRLLVAMYAWDSNAFPGS